MARTSRRVSILVLIPIAVVAVAPIVATAQSRTDAANLAVTWLEHADRQAADGGWIASESLRYAYTAACVEALAAFVGRDLSYRRGIAWIENHGARNQDDLARRVYTLARHGDTTTADADRLVAGRRSASTDDNGWGLSPWYQGSNLDTALAIRALHAANRTTPGLHGVAFLKSRQMSSGAWRASGFVEGGDVVVTAEVVRSLSLYRALDEELPQKLTSAMIWLEAAVSPGSPALWRALAALAIHSVDPTHPEIGILIDSLVMNTPANGGQEGDGSWNGDVYATAMAVRAIAAVLGTDTAENDAIVNMTDARLREAVNKALKRNAADALTRRDLRRLTNLSAANYGITNLTGLEYATNLQWANLNGNQITNLAPITALRPSYLTLSGNPLNYGADTDGDGLSDGVETGTGLWLYSQSTGTILVNPDTDGDGVGDAADDYPLDPEFSSAVVSIYNGVPLKLDLDRSQPIGASSHVDLDDFVIFWKAYGKSTGEPGFHPDIPDLNGNGTIDAADFVPWRTFLWLGWSPSN